MTNDEKAEEICRDYNYTQFLNDGTKDIYTESAVLYMLEKMAQWKDEQALRAFCRLTCPDLSCLDNNEKPCESYKLFKKILKGE